MLAAHSRTCSHPLSKDSAWCASTPSPQPPTHTHTLALLRLGAAPCCVCATLMLFPLGFPADLRVFGLSFLRYVCVCVCVCMYVCVCVCVFVCIGKLGPKIYVYTCVHAYDTYTCTHIHIHTHTHTHTLHRTYTCHSQRPSEHCEPQKSRRTGPCACHYGQPKPCSD